jgi:hypothetical protein
MRSTSTAPVAHVTWDQALAFRMNRQFLELRTTKNAVEVTRRLCGVQAQVASAAALAIYIASFARLHPWREGVGRRRAVARDPRETAGERSRHAR